jgi:hypothetical protein
MFICADNTSSVYVGVHTTSRDIITINGFDSSFNGEKDISVMKFVTKDNDNNGNNDTTSESSSSIVPTDTTSDFTITTSPSYSVITSILAGVSVILILIARRKKI